MTAELTIVPCPDEATHGNPFRYCACGWMETPAPSADETGGFNAYEVDGQRYIAHDGIQWVPVSDAYTLHLLAGKIDALTEKQSEIAGMLATVVEQVGPTLDKISDHPMLKMFLGGK